MLKVKETYNVGRAKYVVTYYTGKKHPDGSDFYDIRILKSKREADKFITSLWENHATTEKQSDELPARTHP